MDRYGCCSMLVMRAQVTANSARDELAARSSKSRQFLAKYDDIKDTQ